MTDLVTPSTPEAEDTGDLDRLLERHRRELTGYCYRMLGGAGDAEDAVQETMLRAWRGFGSFEGRSAVRSWLYRIATNVCLEMLRSRQRRALPMDLAAPMQSGFQLGPRLPESTFVQPMPDGQVLSGDDDPAARAVGRESVRLAFVAALQHLSPRQRAVLILRDVLRWKASEVAQLLDATVVSVNSALQRGRASLAAIDRDSPPAPHLADTDDPQTKAFLERYVDAFERFDIDLLVRILHEDVTLAMPPFDLWIQGRPAVLDWAVTAPGLCRNGRFVPVGTANGAPAFGLYHSRDDGRFDLFGIHVVEIVDGRARSIQAHLDPSLGRLFDLPPVLGLAEIDTRVAASRS
ncbi:MAG TPA: sigma-70 family RNA polymerase sigma factor [Acidimicrobiales bacterium]|nr:sigma-70 family RNA polymerase sigma factor [Acidimicrobiales bacterium]